MLPPNQWRDRYLVFKARNGDTRAFEQLYHRHKRCVHGMLYRMTGNTADAEDLTQETFLAALKSLSSWRGQGAFSTYLCGIAYRLYCGHRRRPTNEPLDDTEEVADMQADPWQHLGERERMEALQAAIQQLPDTCREAFILVRIEELNYREAAEILGVPLGTLQSRLFRANRLLQKSLTAWANPPTETDTLPTPPQLPNTIEKGTTRHALR